MLPIYIHGVAEGLEGIEGDADRQEDIQGGNVQRNVRLCKYRLYKAEGEVEVLEPDQDAEVRHEAQRNNPLLASFASCIIVIPGSHPLETKSAEPGDKRGGKDQQRVLRVPAHIEIITRRQQPVLFHLCGKQIVQKHDDGEENHIFPGVKQQCSLSLDS